MGDSINGSALSATAVKRTAWPEAHWQNLQMRTAETASKWCRLEKHAVHATKSEAVAATNAYMHVSLEYFASSITKTLHLDDCTRILR